MIKKLTKHLLVRYVISGGTSAVVNLSIFTILFKLGVYYIIASIIAFVVSFFVSLVLQKFWTFKDSNMDDFHKQIGKYLVSSLFGLSINTLSLYILVDVFVVHPIVGQIFAGLITACTTFFITKNYIFHNGKHAKDGLFSIGDNHE